MPCQFTSDCLHNIFEFLEKDKVTLHSCILVNRLWCEVSIRILWRNNYTSHDFCLPNESKSLLCSNGIFIPTSKPPLFNYASFYKVLYIDDIYLKVPENIIQSELMAQEILKMFMNQTSLKKLVHYSWRSNTPNLTQFPGARDCLMGLSKFCCKSNVSSEFCYQLSQICHNIQSLTIRFNEPPTTSNGLKDLISSQNSLKYLSLKNFSGIIPSLTKHSTTLIKLKLHCLFNHRFDLSELQNVTFSQFQILKFRGGGFPDAGSLIKFLEINGKNLKEFYAKGCDKSINLAIAKFCPKLKSLYTSFYYNEGGLEALKTIFHSCEQLKKIKVRCGEYNLSENLIFKIVAEHSPKNFQELELNTVRWSGLLSEDFESFFISWKNRTSQKPLSFIVVDSCIGLDKIDENMKIIEKYKRLGTIKNFEVKRERE